MSTKTLPIISLDDARSDQLAQAFEEFGCCYLTGHGITSALESATLASAQSFFALPEDTKAAIPVVQNGQGFTRGYIGIGKESGSQERIEVKEAFSYGYEWEQGTTSFANGLQGANVWPPQSSSSSSGWDASHKAALNEFYAKMAQASRSVSKHLGKSVYSDTNFLDKFCQQGDTISIMRAFHYFPYEKFGQPAPEGFEFIGSSPHTDWGFLTLILQDPVGGLQIFHKDEWIDVPYIPGTIVANAGDYLSLITNGKCVSPIHRVVAADRERYSMVFFYYPDFDAVIPSLQQDRIGGNRGDQVQSFNNLLDGTVKKVDGCFGDYIMAKWAGVQR
uniref:Fe2OG dioxygenase domain-containing protein n=1 Tax=Globisporangium ultimum (strain ATCC 200006 / CBS 805.95 / DAOM BR144) TaxID=431595 RepID=K3WDL2_GLOUD